MFRNLFNRNKDRKKRELINKDKQEHENNQTGKEIDKEQEVENNSDMENIKNVSIKAEENEPKKPGIEKIEAYVDKYGTELGAFNINLHNSLVNVLYDTVKDGYPFQEVNETLLESLGIKGTMLIELMEICKGFGYRDTTNDEVHKGIMEIVYMILTCKPVKDIYDYGISLGFDEETILKIPFLTDLGLINTLLTINSTLVSEASENGGIFKDLYIWKRNSDINEAKRYGKKLWEDVIFEGNETFIYRHTYNDHFDIYSEVSPYVSKIARLIYNNAIVNNVPLGAISVENIGYLVARYFQAIKNGDMETNIYVVAMYASLGIGPSITQEVMEVLIGHSNISVDTKNNGETTDGLFEEI